MGAFLRDLPKRNSSYDASRLFMLRCEVACIIARAAASALSRPDVTLHICVSDGSPEACDNTAAFVAAFTPYAFISTHVVLERNADMTTIASYYA